MSQELDIRVYLSPYKPIPSQVPGWPAGKQATWPASTSTLIAGPHSAVLVDALMTKEESVRLASWVQGSGKDLRAVYVTHPHADHMFGIGALLAAFPSARPVTLASMAPFMAEQASAGYLAVWNSFFPGQIADDLPLPGPLDGDTFDIDQHTIRFVSVGRSDTEPSSVVHVPDSRVVIAGDVAYNKMHMWLAGSTNQTRQGWLRALDIVESLRPARIITGHPDPGAPDDDAKRILDESRQYILDFDESVAASSSASELIRKMTRLYPDLGNPYTLWVAANDMFSAASGS